MTEPAPPSSPVAFHPSTYRPCRVCVVRVPTRRMLIRHYLKAHAMTRLRWRKKAVPRLPRCVHCGGTLRRRVDREHWMGEIPVRCAECGTYFSLSRWQPLIEQIPLEPHPDAMAVSAPSAADESA